jgi:hypothetical protein
MLATDVNVKYIKVKTSLYLLSSVGFQFFLTAPKHLPFSAGTVCATPIYSPPQLTYALFNSQKPRQVRHSRNRPSSHGVSKRSLQRQSKC